LPYRFLCSDKSFPPQSPPRAPCEVTFIPCPGVTLCGLQKASPHSVGFFPCPHKSVLSSWVTLTQSLSFRHIERLLALLWRCLSSARLRLRWRFAPAPCLAIRLALQRLGCCSGGFSAPPADPAPAVPLAMASVQRLRQRQHCRPRAPSLCRHPTPSSHRTLPGDATSHVAVAVAAIIAIATAIATTTEAPHSDRRCPHDGDVALHRTPSLHRPARQCGVLRRTHCCHHYRHPHDCHHDCHCGHHQGTAPRRTQPWDGNIAPPEVPEA